MTNASKQSAQKVLYQNGIRICPPSTRPTGDIHLQIHAEYCCTAETGHDKPRYIAHTVRRGVSRRACTTVVQRYLISPGILDVLPFRPDLPVPVLHALFLLRGTAPLGRFLLLYRRQLPASVAVRGTVKVTLRTNQAIAEVCTNQYAIPLPERPNVPTITRISEKKA